MDPTSINTGLGDSPVNLNTSFGLEEDLQLKPWETAIATMRLNVPRKFSHAHCPVITNWVILTGTSCAGKTTIIKELEKAGFPVVHESSRAYVEAELRKGRKIEEIKADDRAFRRKVFTLTRDTEADLLHMAHKLIFFDRAAMDYLSVYRASGYDPHEVLNELQPYRYGRVFHCNPLPFVDDGTRTLNENRRMFIDSAIEYDYRALGYPSLRVPVRTVAERVDLILSRCPGA